jgi:hypothetical protein
MNLVFIPPLCSLFGRTLANILGGVLQTKLCRKIGVLPFMLLAQCHDSMVQSVSHLISLA